MKKLLFLFLLFLIPFSASAKEEYELVLTKDFLSYAEKYEQLDVANEDEKKTFYETSQLSIRDYLLYRNCLKELGDVSKFEDGMVLSNVSNRYEIQDDLYLTFIDDYSTYKIHLVDEKNSDFTSLDFSNRESLLDSSIFHYYLLYKSILEDSSTLDFVRDDSYGKLVSKNTHKELVLLKQNQDQLYFEVPNEVNVSDNTSFVVVNMKNPTGLEYISVIFSREDSNRNMIFDVPFMHSGMILLGIILLFVMLEISLFLRKKK